MLGWLQLSVHLQRGFSAECTIFQHSSYNVRLTACVHPVQRSKEREPFCITQLVTVTNESFQSQFMIISPEPHSFSWVSLALQIEGGAAPATNGHSHGFNKTLLGHWVSCDHYHQELLPYDTRHVLNEFHWEVHLLIRQRLSIGCQLYKTQIVWQPLMWSGKNIPLNVPVLLYLQKKL